MDQSKIEAVVNQLSVLEGLDMTYRAMLGSRRQFIEIDQTASEAIDVIEKLREEVERLEGENAELSEERHSLIAKYEEAAIKLSEAAGRLLEMQDRAMRSERG